MVAFFTNGDLKRVNVNGNGESIYFALEGDTTLTGMNKAICSNMVLKFAENKLDRISFLVNPDASFIPPHELNDAEKQLEGFTWHQELRPGKPEVFAPRAAVAPKPAAKNQKKNKKQTKAQQKKRETPAKRQATPKQGRGLKKQ